MNQEQRAALRKVAEEATPGPWYVNGRQSVRGSNKEYIANSNWKNGMQNAAHIAAANPSAILQLLDYIETLEKDAGRYQWLRDEENNLTEDDPCVSDSFFNSWFGEELDKVIDEMIERNAAMQGETE